MPVDKNKYFKDKKGNIKYNETCEACPYDCKQSWRASIYICKHTKELKEKEKMQKRMEKKK